MKIVYIAGPYRAATPHGILDNIRAAERVAISVWRTGNVAICPHMNSAFFDGLVSDEIFLAGTMQLLKRCDAVVLIPNWQQSKGTIKELCYCFDTGIPVYTTAHNLYHDNKVKLKDVQFHLVMNDIEAEKSIFDVPTNKHIRSET